MTRFRLRLHGLLLIGVSLRQKPFAPGRLDRKARDIREVLDPPVDG